MKHTLRILTAGILMFLLLVLQPFASVLAQISVPSLVSPAPTEPPYIGTVVISKKGYQSVRESPTDATIVFRVHYGERYLCTEDTGDGWYKIVIPEFPSSTFGYVSGKPENTTLLRNEIGDITMSDTGSFFMIQTKKRVFLYSQPKNNAQMRRISGDKSSETTFYYPKDTMLTAYAKTIRGGKDWYLVIGNNNGVMEPGWMAAADCEVLFGNPDAKLIPGSWYD